MVPMMDSIDRSIKPKEGRKKEKCSFPSSRLGERSGLPPYDRGFGSRIGGAVPEDDMQTDLSPGADEADEARSPDSHVVVAAEVPVDGPGY
mmetsp:Transcript_35501/g.106006  ORF Transcript_35501/g.106006 Transcript_35501/m.106006 type:complete len:91 (-) Transcript_35501:1460-1732(-)